MYGKPEILYYKVYLVSSVDLPIPGDDNLA